jgi:hypothetical protein
MAKRGRPRKTHDTAAPAQTIENISDDQLQALFFQSKRDYEKNLATKKKADADFKNCCKRIKAELGKRGVDEIKLAVTLTDENGEAEAKADIESTIRVMRWMGVPIGTQADLFPDNDPTPITDRAFAEGRRHGIAGEPRSNPHHYTTEAAASYEVGFADGQAVLATDGFLQTDGRRTPNGRLSKEEWATKTAADNEAVTQAIKSGAIDSLTQNKGSHHG